MDVVYRDVFKKSKIPEKSFLDNFLELLKVGGVWQKFRNLTGFGGFRPKAVSHASFTKGYYRNQIKKFF